MEREVKEMAWTEMQEQAIHKKGKNMIVSAGAGSGKTAVLSERILTYCKEGKDICSFLVLTFTNAAAQEMKERIRKKLLEHNLKEQASRIDVADITTFDAYSLSLVKKYYFYLGIDKNISIMDQALLEVKKKELLDQLFEENYTSKNTQFFSLLKKYTKQSDENLKGIILSLFQKLELIVDENQFVNTYEENYYSKKFVQNIIHTFEELVLRKSKNFVNELVKLLECASEDTESKKLADTIEALLPSKPFTSYEEAYEFLSTLALPRLSSNASLAVKEQKTFCGEELKQLKTKYFSKYSTLKAAEEEIYAIKEDVLYLLELALEVQKRLYQYKLELMSFDYMDIAKMAIRLVQNNATVLSEIKNGFTEILIDEYQDTSDIQETFIQLISKNNCYMVGDIKQSIYRFRNANPYIFKEKYSRYSSMKEGIKIDLTYNFRSRNEVVDDINLIFSNLMTLDQGDANYALEHMMRFGQKDYALTNETRNWHMDILSYAEAIEFTEEELEAFICGRKIIALMKERPLCLKGKGALPLEYSDIAILIDKTKSFTTFKRVFEYLGIPLSIEADLSLNDSILPKLFSNIFYLIVQKSLNQIDTAYWHALASIGRSFLFAYPDEVIYQMLKNSLQTELTQRIDLLAKEINHIPLQDMFYRIAEVFEVYEKLSTIGDVTTSCVTLDYIHSLFETMAKASMGKEEASAYLKNIFENGIDLKFKLAEDTKNCVRMMTIHKSKGLEFPYCFFPMLGSKFNQADIKDSFGLSLSYGVYIPFSDESNSNTILKALAEEEIKKADLSEKIRLFYVALTRAREKIILVSKALDQEGLLPMDKVRSFNDLLHTKSFFQSYRKEIPFAEIKATKAYRLKKHSLKEVQGKPLSYSFKELSTQSSSKQRISKELVSLTDYSMQKAIELGKRFHECLEVLDFNQLSIEDLPVDSFMKEALKKLLSTPIFENLSLAQTYHEHEFYFQDYHGIIDLLCIYEDHIDIIDYKLSDTQSKEYIRQLEIYKAYVESKSKLPVSCYLLSILRQDILKVF